MKVEEHSAPFYHAIVDDFLPKAQLEELRGHYSRQAFNEIYTDLYSFMQTGELSHMDELDFFKERLDDVLGKHYSLDRRYYNIFGSYYRTGDGLLVHDDLVGNRVFAFAFYLEDFQSGEFLMYEKDCATLSKSIPVRKNRLLVFQVGESSFHEVGTCRAAGRMAVVGWFNSTDVKVPASSIRSALYIPESLQYYRLPVPVPGPGEMRCIPFEDVDTAVLSERLVGPFIYHRYIRIEQELLYVPRLEGYELVHADCISIDEEGYVLCNDAINDAVDDIIDIFIFKHSSETVSNFIMYISISGDRSFALDAVPGNMMIGPRDGHTLCIMRADRHVGFKHFIYKKIN